MPPLAFERAPNRRRDGHLLVDGIWLCNVPHAPPKRLDPAVGLLKSHQSTFLRLTKVALQDTELLGRILPLLPPFTFLSACVTAIPATAWLLKCHHLLPPPLPGDRAQGLRPQGRHLQLWHHPVGAADGQGEERRRRCADGSQLKVPFACSEKVVRV